MEFVYKGTSIYYEILGNKNLKKIPILFLHGWGGNKDSFKPFIDKIKFCKVIVLDFPPFGKSGKPNIAWGVEDYTDMVLSLLDKLGINKVNIVAHSFGGRVSLQLAIKEKHLVNKMLLTGCAGLKRRSLKTKIKIIQYKVLKKLSILGLVSQKALLKYGSNDYLGLDAVMRQTFNNIVNYDQTKILSKITCPVLLFWGKKDKATPFCFTKIFKKHIKYCTVIKIDNGSHFAYLENPKLFFHLICSFLG